MRGGGRDCTIANKNTALVVQFVVFTFIPKSILYVLVFAYALIYDFFFHLFLLFLLHRLFFLFLNTSFGFCFFLKLTFSIHLCYVFFKQPMIRVKVENAILDKIFSISFSISISFFVFFFWFLHFPIVFYHSFFPSTF